MGEYRTLNGVVRELVAGNVDEWEARMPFAECIPRDLRMKVLGGRNPYGVDAGLAPRMLFAALTSQPVESMEIGECVAKLRQYMGDIRGSDTRAQNEALAAQTGTLGGHLSKQLFLVGAVLVQRESKADRRGPLRFQLGVHPGIYHVIRSVDRNTFFVKYIADVRAEIPFAQPPNADR